MRSFLFVGDSMTIGCPGDFTWRYRMWQHLEAGAATGEPYEIVGPRTALYDPATGEPSSHAYGADDFPAAARRHLAGWGEGWLHMAPAIRRAVEMSGANTLLVSLGLIDLGFYTNAEQTAENLGLFLSEARAADPHIALVVHPVIPNVRAERDAPFAAECTRFNELLAKTVADRDAPGSPILLASPHPAYDIHTDTYDGTHPGPSGEHKLAAAFADAMHQAWGWGSPYAAPYGASRSARAPHLAHTAHTTRPRGPAPRILLGS
ncbi:GDSL-type esterase/lipase family protein [Streptomyces sp. NPDC058657]|uniref:GDSL-type esterase/lipase family protein n=1 Tax=unclassified Streptomyces TaxID=2593676 RepID=UPI003646B450